VNDKVLPERRQNSSAYYPQLLNTWQEFQGKNLKKYFKEKRVTHLLKRRYSFSMKCFNAAGAALKAGLPYRSMSAVVLPAGIT
jgi:hypothetical protein